MFQEEYDVIVVGAMLVLKAAAANQVPNAQMSCNPAMGGIAKDK
jgi:tRNA U34 5-carboxymethylaminomethyl modifying enzyme MnmG/GidA